MAKIVIQPKDIEQEITPDLKIRMLEEKEEPKKEEKVDDKVCK